MGIWQQEVKRKSLIKMRLFDSFAHLIDSEWMDVYGASTRCIEVGQTTDLDPSCHYGLGPDLPFSN